MKLVRNLRYSDRIPFFREKFGKLGYVIHHVWWVFHNCIVHPLAGLIPIGPVLRLHDLSSNHLNASGRAETKAIGFKAGDPKMSPRASGSPLDASE